MSIGSGQFGEHGTGPAHGGIAPVRSGQPSGSGPRATPFESLTGAQLRRLAKRADRVRGRDVTEFESLAASASVSPRQLRLVADAWAEGGQSGLTAIGPPQPVADPEIMDRAIAVIETWRRRHFPLDALQTDVWRNIVTVNWLVPGHVRSGELTQQPLMQLRRTEDGRWHLYRRAVQGEWWPVSVRGRRRRQSLSACLDEVRIDPLRHFWGEGGPPTDLAAGDALPDSPLD